VTLAYTYDGAALTHKVAPSGIDIPQRADMGEVSMGGIPIEDPAGDLTMLGHRPFTVEESACAQPRLFTGWTAERGIGRDLDLGLFVGPNPRIHDATILDLNALFGFRLISGADAKRPEETWEARLEWILHSDYLTGLISTSRTFTDTWPNPMDEADYTGSYPSSVLDDLAQRFDGAVNYFAFWDPAGAAVTLFMDHVAQGIADCTLSISNLIADVNSTTCFAPDSIARLQREPDQTYSEVIVEYANGKVFRTAPATATKYIRRGTTISRPYTGKKATAEAQGDQFLAAHSEEVDRITCSIRVPAASVGLVRAGQRISVRFSHMPGYETATWMRIVGCSPKPTDDLARYYDVALEMVGALPPGCPDPTPTGSFWPMGSATSDATGNVAYLRAGIVGLVVPTPGFVGAWHFPQYGGGGSGTVDYMGDCVGNVIRCLVIGPGTMTIKTRVYDGPIRHLDVALMHAVIVNGVVGEILDSLDQTHHSGDDIVVVIPASEWCERWVEVSQTKDDPSGCGSKIGFAGMEWVAGGITVTGTDLGPPPGATTTHTVDPTVTDDYAAGYTVGSTWINTTTDEVFILTDSTTGAAVWVSVTDFAPTGVDYLVGTASSALSAEIVVGTTPGGELGGTWASPTVDATHSGSAHLALGTTGSTAAAGNHGHAAYRGELLITDTPAGSPLIFADLVQNDAGTDLLYADP
jgi:hypothetical protein